MDENWNPTAELIFPETLANAGMDPRRLRRARDRELVRRIRRGVYVEADRWESASERERHILRIAGGAVQARRPFVAAGESAAALWEVPIATTWPETVTVLDEHRGGGRSEPGVRRVTTGASTAVVETRFGLATTSLARTALDIARRAPFPAAVAALDWAICAQNPLAIGRQQLALELERFQPRVGFTQAEAALAFATPQSGSAGESHARAAISLAGFDDPVLQLRLVDGWGEMFVDFAWPGARVIVEFDGDVKFTDPRFGGGDPAERIRHQRRRDNRLRALGWVVVHIEWPDVMSRARLVAMLGSAGVPRRGE